MTDAFNKAGFSFSIFSLYNGDVMEGLKSQKIEGKEELSMIPQRYRSLPADIVEELWQPVYYADPEKTQREREKRDAAIRALRASEQQTNTPVDHGFPFSERGKLYGWGASYALASIAKKEDVDLSKLSREEYVAFAVAQSLAIDDDQLRAAPWQRMALSSQEIVAGNKERRSNISDGTDKEFATFAFEMKTKAVTANRELSAGVRVRQGTQASDSWLFFGINEGLPSQMSETHKSYFSFKDLNEVRPEEFISFMKELQKAGYTGDVKIFQDLKGQGVRLNDQVVIHGASLDDALLGLAVAKKLYGDKLGDTSLGKDERIDGVDLSYSQILARTIKESIARKGNE